MKPPSLTAQSLAALAIGACIAVRPVRAQDGAPPPPPFKPDAPAPQFTPPPPPPPGFRPPPPPNGFDISRLAPGEALHPVDLKAAPAALKAVADASRSLTAGQVWVDPRSRTGEPVVEASVLFQNREVARLRFNASDASLLPKGYHEGPAGFPMQPPFGPGRGGPKGPRSEDFAPPGPPSQPGAGPESAPIPPPPNGSVPPPPPNMKAPPGQPPAGPRGNPLRGALPPAPAVSPESMDAVKTKLAEVVKALIPGNGAEVSREGTWRVPLVYEGRIVGEIPVLGDGSKVMQDLNVARDAVIFAK